MTTVVEPTVDLVNAARDVFDKTFQLVEETLDELFHLFPTNDNPRHVLMKVVVLNRLYSTQIFAVETAASKISNNATEIDSAIAVGSPAIVDTIAKIEIGETVRNNFSFATKYCSRHKPELYPIYDSRVDIYLWQLQKQVSFTTSKFPHSDLWDYPKFVEVMKSFRSYYGLESFNFKEIDKFIWLQGEPQPTAQV